MVQARSGLWLLPALLVLQACGSTPFGQQLSESFDPPPATPTASQPPVAKGSSATAASPRTAAPTTAASKIAASKTEDPDKPSQSQEATKPPAPAAKPQSRPQAPQPYRITIRLSAADPSAPAEVVTRSLRDAGIGFEVETIERIQPPDSLRVAPEPRGANP